MGKYIDYIDGKHIGTSYEEKISSLVAQGAVKVASPQQFKPNTLVCVIDNGPFAAAGYAYSEQEMIAFRDDGSDRPRQWLELENASSYIN